MRFLLGVALVLAACGSAGGRATIVPAAPRATVVPAWWPSDLLGHEGDLTAWRWLKKSEFDCTYSDVSCWGMKVITRDGCPSSLYVELSILDSSGTAIGYTNDTVGSVAARQEAKLVFDTFEEDAEKARLAEISCY